MRPKLNAPLFGARKLRVPGYKRAVGRSGAREWVRKQKPTVKRRPLCLERKQPSENRKRCASPGERTQRNETPALRCATDRNLKHETINTPINTQPGGLYLVPPFERAQVERLRGPRWKEVKTDNDLEIGHGPGIESRFPLLFLSASLKRRRWNVSWKRVRPPVRAL